MVSFPAAILPELQHHLDTHSLDGPDGLVFVNEGTGSRGIAEPSIALSAGGRLASRSASLTSTSTICGTPEGS